MNQGMSSVRRAGLALFVAAASAVAGSGAEPAAQTLQFPKIRRTLERLPDGVVTVTESDDPCVVSLIRAHADVASQFIRNGHDEVPKNHAVPPGLK